MKLIISPNITQSFPGEIKSLFIYKDLPAMLSLYEIEQLLDIT